jgi:MFS family permease
MTDLTQKKSTILVPAVIVAALGYFVDVYDLLLFSIVRVNSLKDLGITGEAQMTDGLFLLNMQMIGMLIGGVLWGVLGDKRGRLSVLFGSIITYSVANLANAFVGTVGEYALWRFIAGIGLAGELGVGITLVAEVLPKESRGYGTTIVASVGILGAVLAAFLADMFTWRQCYIIGGVLGLSLLALRVGITESGMFKQVKISGHTRGDFLSLFKKKQIFLKYLRFILIGLPVWYAVGILITLSPELGIALHIQGAVNSGQAVMYCYAGLAFGDLSSGLLSQRLRSRKKVLYIYWALSAFSASLYFLLQGIELQAFYYLCAFVGFTVGSWVVFMTAAAEQFGTNIRATVSTSVPNFVRGAVVPMTGLFAFLKINLPDWGLDTTLEAAIITGVIVLAVAVWAITGLRETYEEDLNYMEQL